MPDPQVDTAKVAPSNMYCRHSVLLVKMALGHPELLRKAGFILFSWGVSLCIPLSLGEACMCCPKCCTNLALNLIKVSMFGRIATHDGLVFR